MKQEIVVMDFESGGIKPEQPNIQLAAIAVDESWNEIDSFERKIRFDPAACSPEALKINHYDPELWKDAQDEIDVFRDFMSFLAKHATMEQVSKRTGNPYKVARLAAYNAPFDKDRLWAMSQGNFVGAYPQVLCLLQRSMFYVMENNIAVENHRLTTIAKALGLPVDDAHDALGDVRMSAAAYRKIRMHRERNHYLVLALADWRAMLVESEGKMTDELFPITDGSAELPPIIADRSRLQRWATCPQQAAQVDRRMVHTGSVPATIGSRAHECYAAACKSRRMEGASASGIRDMLEMMAMDSRPDISMHVLAAIKYSSWAFAKLVTTSPTTGKERAPEDCLRFDSGDGNMSGQLSWDLQPATEERGPIRLTGELDLLMATESVEEVDVWDWKTGHSVFNAGMVKESFQFQYYAFLVLTNYQAVQRVAVRVFMTHKNETTPAVVFRREDMFPIQRRIQSAVDLMMQWKDASLADIPTYESIDACSMCPAIMTCPTGRGAFPEATDHVAMLRELAVTKARVDKMETILTNYVRGKNENRDIVVKVGDRVLAFGTAREKVVRQSPCELYEPKDANAPPKSPKRTPRRPNPDPVEDNNSMPGEQEMSAAIDSIPFVPTPMPTMPDIAREGVGPLFQESDIPTFGKDGKVKP